MKILLLVVLLVLFIAYTPSVNYGQQAAPATGGRQRPETEKTAALNEATSLSRQVVELYKADKFDEALPLAERVLANREKALAANDRRIAEALANIAALRLAKKDNDKAETFYHRALAVYEAAGDQGSDNVISVLSTLVFLSASKRNFDKAETLAQRLVAIAEKKYQPQQLEMARALVNLAEVHRLRSDNKQARTVYARIVDIVDKYSPAAVPKEIRLSLANYLGLLYEEEKGRDSDLTERINKLFLAIASGATPGSEKEVQGGVLNGKALYKPAPDYPFSAKQTRRQGVVTVQVTVDETGKVIAAKATQSPDLSLSRVSEAAARGARFTPTLLSGTPVKVTGIITYNFVLQ
ncbi:MAG: TonB family protein [Pyrinomonadaceae bacterium]